MKLVTDRIEEQENQQIAYENLGIVKDLSKS